MMRLSWGYWAAVLVISTALAVWSDYPALTALHVATAVFACIKLITSLLSRSALVEQFQARQGDVFLVRVGSLPKRAWEHGGDGKEVILARGEVTGHAHRIISPDARLWRDDKEKTYLSLTAAATLTHEEHGPIPLPQGIYQVIRQREYEPGPLRERTVED